MMAFAASEPLMRDDSVYVDAPFILRETVASEFIIQLCRLWDKFDAGGFSLPTIASLLRDNDVWNELELGDDIKLKEEKLRSLSDALKLVSYVDNTSLELKTIRNSRHKRAHPIFRTRDERKGKVDDPAYSDVEYVLNHAIEALNPFRGALSMPNEDYRTLKETANADATAFFQAIKLSD